MIMKGVKKDLGKPQLRLLFLQFPKALEQVVRCSEFGHEKYPEDVDWKNMYRVENAEDRYADAALRHLSAHIQNDKIDAESKLFHLSHLCWNTLSLLEIELNKPTETIVQL